ncbi:MAG: hypothetical protein ACRDD7_06330, partial [Peptostreptococcaceae bacterium]
NSTFTARSVVEYKLKDRLDFRKIRDIQEIKGVVGDKNSKYYNSSNAYDGKELQCVNGWNYKWR